MNPTVGRIVHYYPKVAEQDELHETVGKPLAAIVVTVHEPDLVNLTVFDANGGTHSRTSVRFSDNGAVPYIPGGFATWPERAAG